MARRGMGSFAGGFAQGLEIGSNIKSADARRKSQELQDENLRADMADRQRQRELEAARQEDIRSSFNPGDPNYGQEDFRRDEIASTNNGGVQVSGQASKVRPFDAMLSAATKRFAAGDVDGYADLLNKGAAAKTLYYTTSFTDAYRRGDVQGMLGLLNDFPDGNKYDVQQGPNGRLVATLSTPDGKPIGSKEFADVRELGGFIQQQLNPGDIAATIRAELEQKTKKAVAEANIRQSDAAAAASSAQANRTTTLLPHEIARQQADVRQSDAAAAASRASAGAAGQTAEMRNFGFMRGLPEDQRGAFEALLRPQGYQQDPTVLAGQKALLEAYTDPLKRSTLTPDQVQQAEGLLAQAQGQALVPKGGPGVRRPPAAQQGSGAPTVANALQQARDAIAKGADRNAVIQRLKQNGIDPKGL